MEKQKNIPVLRFPEFSKSLESNNLGEITSWSSGGTPSKERPQYWNGNIPWITASSMHGFEYFDSEYKITKEGLINGSRLAKEGQLLILVRGSMLFNKIPVGIALKDVAFNQDVKSVDISAGNSAKFILYWFFSKENVILNLVTGTGIGAGKLDLSDLKNLTLQLPSLPEQTKIATFLTTIDDRLNQLKKKKSLLEQYKKGVMQKIFDQEIRFKDEDGNEYPDWEEKKLGEVAVFFKGKGLPKSDLSANGRYKCIHYGELFTTYKELITNIINKTDKFDNPFLSISNDVLMPTSDVTPNGLATASCIKEDNIILGGDILVIRLHKMILDGVFFAYYILITENNDLKSNVDFDVRKILELLNEKLGFEPLSKDVLDNIINDALNDLHLNIQNENLEIEKERILYHILFANCFTNRRMSKEFVDLVTNITSHNVSSSNIQDINNYGDETWYLIDALCFDSFNIDKVAFQEFIEFLNVRIKTRQKYFEKQIEYLKGNINNSNFYKHIMYCTSVKRTKGLKITCNTNEFFKAYRTGIFFLKEVEINPTPWTFQFN